MNKNLIILILIVLIIALIYVFYPEAFTNILSIIPGNAGPGVGGASR